MQVAGGAGWVNKRGGAHWKCSRNLTQKTKRDQGGLGRDRENRKCKDQKTTPQRKGNLGKKESFHGPGWVFGRGRVGWKGGGNNPEGACWGKTSGWGTQNAGTKKGGGKRNHLELFPFPFLDTTQERNSKKKAPKTFGGRKGNTDRSKTLRRWNFPCAKDGGTTLHIANWEKASGGEKKTTNSIFPWGKEQPNGV